jgi:hypothetical protein
VKKISRRDLVKATPALAAFAVGSTPLLADAKIFTQKAAAATTTGPFPAAGIDSFLSHFIIAIKILQGTQAGQTMNLALPSALQSVSRSDPFTFQGGSANQSVTIPLPSGSRLPNTISFRDFAVQPPGFFTAGTQQIWLQILDLDARLDTPSGTVRITLGETFKREHPTLFAPSFGAAQSLGASGFPARLFFSPNAIIETPFGAFHTRAGKALVGDQVTQFPPIGSAPTLLQPVLLDSIDNPSGTGDAEIIGLAHPIDAAIANDITTASQTRASKSKRK